MFLNVTNHRFFDISYNKINIGGAKMLSEMIQMNTTLQGLDISHCSISSDGALTICECFKSYPTLQKFNFSHNEIATEGAKAILEVIHFNEALQHLNISNCGIPDVIKTIIRQSFVKSPQHILQI